MSGTTSGRPTPGVWRRLAALLYEGLLLFGVVMLAGWVYGIVTQQRHALHGRTGLQAFVFVVLALYFVWFWTHGGQTLAMKTWKLRVETADGRPLTWGRALARYLLAWMWVLPSLLAVRLAGLSGGWVVSLTLAAGIGAYALVARLHPDRQFLHDALCRTRLVDAPPPPTRPR